MCFIRIMYCDFSVSLRHAKSSPPCLEPVDTHSTCVYVRGEGKSHNYGSKYVKRSSNLLQFNQFNFREDNY